MNTNSSQLDALSELLFSASNPDLSLNERYKHVIYLFYQTINILTTKDTVFNNFYAQFKHFISRSHIPFNTRNNLNSFRRYINSQNQLPDISEEFLCQALLLLSKVLSHEIGSEINMKNTEINYAYDDSFFTNLLPVNNPKQNLTSVKLICTSITINNNETSKESFHIEGYDPDLFDTLISVRIANHPYINFSYLTQIMH